MARRFCYNIGTLNVNADLLFSYGVLQVCFCMVPLWDLEEALLLLAGELRCLLSGEDPGRCGRLPLRLRLPPSSHLLKHKVQVAGF